MTKPAEQMTNQTAPPVDNPTDNLIDFAALEKQLKNCATEATAEHLTLLKQAVVSIDDGLKEFYQNGGDVNAVVYGRSNLTDRLIKIIYDFLLNTLDQEIALVAVGGYGRGELHPKSDIDLMVLLQEKENQNTKDLLGKFLMLLWDIRLEIGHSVRTVSECIEESSKDITVATNIMEARLLAGNETLFLEMKDKTSADFIWDSKTFFQAKLDEQIQRNGKFNDTAYNLEPNIKESRGGLRDIQMIGWVAKRHFNAHSPHNMSLHDLLNDGFLLEDELNTLLEGQHLLWRIRCSLHYLAGRREDRLLFDYQRDLAKEFGFKDKTENSRNEAIEQFMQQYYRTVIELERLNEMLLQHFREAIIYVDIDTDVEMINDSFQLRNGYIETTRKNIFKENPCAILEMFLILQDYPEIQGVRSATIRQIRKHKTLIDDEVRQSARAQLLFMKIITGSRGVTHELRRMNRYGILAAYIPAFDSIVGRMQYDLFHAYTVDQHTLFVIRNMRRLSVPDYCHEFPLASGVFQHLKNPGLLYLSGLFHDIAKGRDGDHSELGAVDAKTFCTLHGLPKEDCKLVSWLVSSHLIMSMTAQRKDISDPDVINTFAELVETIERLDYLYLLTISDIRATNPKQWNDWKDKLLGELYNKTATLLNKGSAWKNSDLKNSDLKNPSQQSDKEINISEIQTGSLRKLEALGIDSHQAQNLWKTFNTEYFQSHTYGQITWHTSLIINTKQKQILDTPLIKTRVHKSSNSIQLMVYTKDRERIFYDVVSSLNKNDVDIVNAQLLSSTDNYALQTFRLAPENTDNEEMSTIAKQIAHDLEEKLNSNDSATKISLSNSNRKHKYFSSPTVISFQNTNNKTTKIKIETLDRIGVLENIAKTFIDYKIKIINARIVTAGEKAIDYFSICTTQDNALSNEQQQNLRQQLKELL
ncbi:[Protein-PII] uridylyltransferase / [Protein-PII]-UMP uridylyl-removing enzyme [hydrothermal vent metagenome]|uniref:[Protein-PII] uridylyltransferase / [Protein-PII]-UMP uridylyl-removing enzyme n=1 Tax=hydrothermal vent metagenome TaxID=652676 RepID=A0A3B0X2X4_9ZZZZ